MKAIKMPTEVALRRWCFVATAAAAILHIAICSAGAQQPRSKAGPDKSIEFQVFMLKRTNAAEVAKTVDELFPDAEVVADPRTNGVLVKSSAETLRQIEMVLKTIDGAPEPNARKTKILPVRDLELDEALRDALNVIAVEKNMPLAIDQKRGIIITSGDEESLDSVEQLVNALTELRRQSQDSGRSYQIRVVWLVSGLGQETPAPSKDLAHVLAEMQRIGIEDLRMIAQTVVITGSSSDNQSHFVAHGSAFLERDVGLSIQGALLAGQDGGPHQLQMDVVLKGESQHPGQSNNVKRTSSPLCELSTVIKVADGQSVVLGATPIGSLTSVFVVQVSPVGGD